MTCLLPFNGIDDDVEFSNAIFNYSHSANFSTDFFTNVSQLALTSKSIGRDKTIDPDVNLLLENCKDSLCYLFIYLFIYYENRTYLK